MTKKNIHQAMPIKVKDESPEFTVRITASSTGLVRLLRMQDLRIQIQNVSRLKAEEED